MREGFVLAWRTLVRARTLPLLFLLCGCLLFFVPDLVRSDGSPGGMREMYMRAVAGSVVIVVAMGLLCSACGYLSHMREQARAALVCVRPVNLFAGLAGAWLAYLAAAAAVWMMAAGVIYFCVPGGAQPCRHHIAPVLPSPYVAARAMMADYLADPQTPEAVRRAPRAAVLSLLAAKETDRYDPIAPGHTVNWPFPGRWHDSSALTVRVRFATALEMRADLCGALAFGAWRAAVTNNTQARIDIPLARLSQEPAGPGEHLMLSFENKGKDVVMLRPRRDIFLLAPAGSFAANLFRAFALSLANLALAVAFGLFLSAGLSRPVSIFTALVAAAVIFMAPSVIDQFPDELDAAWADRVGLFLSRGVHQLTASLSQTSPLAQLAEDCCVEGRDLMRALFFNMFALPVALLGGAAFVMRRKALPDNA